MSDGSPGMAEIRIGTSGWRYKHWAGCIYPLRLPASKMLGWYQEHFDTVELNNTFYQLPSENALADWQLSTPRNFRFSMKGSRYLTHMKQLKDPAAGLEKFFTRVDLLKEKLGPILFQLPPNFEVNVQRLAEFLDALPTWHRYVFEFRNPSWNCAEILRLLRKHNVAYCSFHLAGYQSPLEITTDITYVRLHGPGAKYQGSYNEEELNKWACRVNAWQRDLQAIYVYFDNDDSGYAVNNALRLRELLT